MEFLSGFSKMGFEKIMAILSIKSSVFVWGTSRLPGRQLSNKAQPKQCLEASPVFSIFVWSADIPLQSYQILEILDI